MSVHPFPIEQEAAPQLAHETRPLYWSIRREFWENRYLYIAPLVVAGLALFGFFIRVMTLPRGLRTASTAAAQRMLFLKPFGLGASVIIVTALVSAAVYALDALHSERRDRSILFWKSLPVSDRTTVMAKALVAMILMPLLALTIAIVLDVVMLAILSLVMIGSRVGLGVMWSHLPFPSMILTMIYGVLAHALWFAPIYAWLLLVSAWARRVPWLWAVLPFPVAAMLEKGLFGTDLVSSFLRYRFGGALHTAFSVNAAKVAITKLSQLSPLRFLTEPGLWLGLLFAAACLWAAARLRRNREPF
jgi:ABC-2 type transport system permease protein